MPERDFIPLVADMVKECESYRDLLSADRIKAIEYYDGIMKDTPSDVGRSAVVAREVMAVVQKVLPSLTRVFLASDQMVEYQPMQQEDEQYAEQATDYINHVIFPECNGEQVLTDSIHDALKTRNSVITWWYDEKKTVKVSKHNGLDDASFSLLAAENEVEVLEHTEREETVQEQPTLVHDAKIRRTMTERKPALACVPLEEFLIHPDALDEDTAPMIGRKQKLRRSDLVAMGYDKDTVWGLPKYGSDGTQDEAEELTRRTLLESGKTELATELEEIDYYTLFVHIDLDDDGIAELRRMCFGGKIADNTLLDNEEADEVNYAICKVKSRSHQWEGVSLADDMMDLQRVNTVLLRNTLDNLYWQNNLQQAVKDNMIEPESMGAVTNPQFGQIIHLSDNATSARDAIQTIEVPFVAEKSFGMMEYIDQEIEDRTGISDASGGLPPDALQNVTAKASSLMEQQGIGQAELMARTLAMGYRRMFKGLLRLIIQHQDKPRMVRLRNEWVEFDPRQWNAEMDCTVNTGLGAGTRERDLITMQAVLGMQKEVLAAYGPTNPYVTPENLGNALTKFAEAAGLRSPRLYFSEPTPEEIQGMKDAQANKPDPEMLKIQAQVEGQKQIKTIELQFEERFKALEMKTNTQKEIIQSQAAVEERKATVAIESGDKDKDRLLKKYEIDERNKIEMLKLGKSIMDDRDNAIREDEQREVEAGEKQAETSRNDNANQRLEAILGMLGDKLDRPRRVKTPDGEEFVMEAFEPEPMAVQ